MPVVVESARGDEAGILHTYLSRSSVHQSGKIPDAARYGYSRVVAALHHHTYGKIIKSHSLAYLEVHGAALGCHLVGELNGLVVRGGMLERDERSHYLSGRSHGQTLIGV